MNSLSPRFFAAGLVSFALVGSAAAATAAKASASAAPAVVEAPTPLPRTDANGNPLRQAPTGHISNYDEVKAGDYTIGLPDPLTLQNGKPVKDAETWNKVRRPEILKLYETEIYGRVPATVPKVTFESFDADPAAVNGTAVRKNIVIRFGERTVGPKLNVTLYLPAKATGPVPVLLHATFFGQPSGAPTPPPNGKAPRPNELGPIADIMGRGYGYAVFRYTDVQPDAANTNQSGLQAMAYAPGQTKPLADEWGTIAVWAWATSRVMDYLETDRSVDAKRVALIGHSRLGKMVLWAGARDHRFSLVFSSCSGEMGAAMARRDYGETVDDLAANFPWQFAGNFQKYAGHWKDLPVDSHLLIALNAPHAVFITGGTQDQWADPQGEFLAALEAGPVYRLLGKKDLPHGTGSPPLGPVNTIAKSGQKCWQEGWN